MKYTESSKPIPTRPLKYSEETFRDMYKALQDILKDRNSALAREKGRKALAKADGKIQEEVH